MIPHRDGIDMGFRCWGGNKNRRFYFQVMVSPKIGAKGMQEAGS